jgi:hypothetical protein
VAGRVLARPGGSLLVNPGAEAGAASEQGWDAVTVPGWQVVSGLPTVVRYGTRHFPRAVGRWPAVRHGRLFVGGAGGTARLRQAVSLRRSPAGARAEHVGDAGASAGLGAGRPLRYRVSAWLGGARRSHARVAVAFMSGAGRVLARRTIGPVGHGAGGARLERRTATGAVPRRAVSARVTLILATSLKDADGPDAPFEGFDRADTVHRYYWDDDLPMTYFDDVRNRPAYCSAHLVPLQAMPDDLAKAATTPSFAWVGANDCTDMEGCGIKSGDEFLARELGAIMRSPAWRTQRSLAIITFDEDGYDHEHPAQRVATLMLGSGVKQGYVSHARYTHYSLLRTIEAALGLGTLTRNDRYAQPVNDVFTRGQARRHAGRADRVRGQLGRGHGDAHRRRHGPGGPPYRGGPGADRAGGDA